MFSAINNDLQPLYVFLLELILAVSLLGPTKTFAILTLSGETSTHYHHLHFKILDFTTSIFKRSPF